MSVCKEKICYIITQGHWGGAQRYVFDVVRQALKNYDCIVAIGSSNEHNDLKERLEEIGKNAPGLQIIDLQHVRREINLFHDFLALFELRSLLRKEKPILVHYNSAKATVIGAIAALGLRIKRIATIHGWTSLEPLSTFRRIFYQFLEYWSCRALDALIVPDTISAEVALSRYHCPREKIFLIPHSIDTPLFLSRDAARSALCSRAPISLEHLWVGTIANLYKTKNIPFLISCFERTAKHLNGKASFIIVGDGPERTAIEKRRCASPYADHIFLLGTIKEAARLIKAFDVFTLGSVKEGYPYVLLEARSAGIPIVSTDVGSCRSLLEGYSPSACVPIDEDTFVHALEQVAASSQQPVPIEHHTSAEEMYQATQDLYHFLLLGKKA